MAALKKETSKKVILHRLRGEPTIAEGYVLLYFPERDVTLFLPAWSSDAENIDYWNGDKFDMIATFHRSTIKLRTERTVLSIPAIQVSLNIPDVNNISLTSVLAWWIWDIYRGSFTDVNDEGIHARPGYHRDGISVYFQTVPLAQEYLNYPAMGRDKPGVYTPGKRSRLDRDYILEDQSRQSKMNQMRQANLDDYQRGRDFSIEEEEDEEMNT